MPVELPSTPEDIRTSLGLKDNPDLFGKKIMVKCDVGTYLGVRGILKVSEYVK